MTTSASAICAFSVKSIGPSASRDFAVEGFRTDSYLSGNLVPFTFRRQCAVPGEPGIQTFRDCSEGQNFAPQASCLHLAGKPCRQASASFGSERNMSRKRRLEIPRTVASDRTIASQ